MFLRFVALIVLCAAYLPAQEYRASISGEVSDSTGSPVLAAKVVVTNVATNATSDALSNESGRYNVSFLQPGKYRLTVEKSGFKKFEREDIILGVSQRVGLDVKLDLGQVSESVTVTGSVSLLQTETATRIHSIEKELIQKVPNNGRNPFLLTHALPGVTKTGYWGSAELYAYGQVGGVSISGGRAGENETLIDGVTDTRPNRGVNFIPALDSLAEVSVQTNLYDAQFSRTGGGVNVFGSKSGTNSFHGAAYEHLKHEKLNALGWNTAKQLAEFRSANPTAAQPNLKFRNNTFGMEVDGPVWIPTLFDGRNRLFFMVSFEGLSERKPSGQAVTLPSPEQRNGDFSALVNNQGRAVTIYDPNSTDPTTGLRTPFAGNRIPANRINPVSSKITSFLPASNTRGQGLALTENFISTIPSKNSYNQWIGKMDYRINAKNNVFFRRGETPWENFARVVWGTNAAEPSGEAPSTRRAISWGADWTSTLSPTMVFNLRAGLSRTENFSGNTYGVGFDPRELGFSPALVSQFDFLQFPRFDLGTYTPIGTEASSTDASDTWSLQPNLNWMKGKHGIKIGTELRRYNQNNIGPGFASGTYAFNRTFTQQNARQADALSGNEFASFLLGNPASGSVAKNINRAFRWQYYSLYLQDDWKVNQKLSLNLGIRWDYEAPAAERYDRIISDFAFDQASPIANRVQGLTLKGGPIFAGVGGNSRQAYDRDLNNFQPRFGVAYRISEKLLFRGGYGLAYLGQADLPDSTGFSQSTPVVASADGGLTPRVSLTNPFPEGIQTPLGSSLGLASNLGQAVSFPFRGRGLPFSQQFSAGFQYELPFNMRADVSYVGNITRGLPLNIEYNFIPLAELNKPAAYYTQLLPNPMAGLVPLNAAKNGATITRQQLLQPYPQYTSVQARAVNIGKQRYDAMQSSVVKRFSSGLSFAVNFTISKTLEQVTLLNQQDFNPADPGASKLEKRLVDYDVPVHFGLLGSYDLPFGRGRKWGSDMNRTLLGVLGAWNLSLNYNRRGGPPLDFPNAGALDARSARLTRDQQANLAKQYGKDKWDSSYVPYFDISLFPRTVPLGTDYRSFPTRFPDVRGLGLNNLDLTIAKIFTIKERLRIEYRAEMMNAMNTTYFRRLIGNGNNVTNARFGFLTDDPTVNGRIVVMVLRATF